MRRINSSRHNDACSYWHLNVFSHFTNTGTFTDNGGVTIMQGKGASNISGNLTFANLRIESVGGTSVTSGITNISKELQVNKSIFNTGNAVVLKSTAAGTARIAELKSTCVYTLNMFDSYGDGWNGGLLTVLENGVSIGTFLRQVQDQQQISLWRAVQQLP
ncbi:MAG: hypothetical protein IPG07_16725 [Crocinitomicaceae bacterium]|nr:hypothetical protein [Crocinitomicaceae bacterium]